MIVVVSPCGHHASGNVGDQLAVEMTQEIIEDVYGSTEFETYYKGEDLTSRLDRINEANAVVLSGIEISQRKTRPRNYRLTRDLNDIEPPIIPDSGTYSFYPGDEFERQRQIFGEKTVEFLNHLRRNCPDGRFPVRDAGVRHVLEQNGYETVLTGDPGLYDLERIGEEFHKPTDIDQLVVTAPQARRYMSQAETLLHRLTGKFEDATRVLSFHSAPRNVDLELADVATRLDWETAFLSHDTDKLELYRDSDLHVGYRYHGHLAHLRWRKPSVVLAEDSRAKGLTKTLGAGGVNAFTPRNGFGFEDQVRRISRTAIETMSEILRSKFGFSTMFFLYHKLAATPDPNAVDEVMKFVDDQLEQGWPAMEKIGNLIDSTYENGMKPYMEAALPQ